MPDYRTEKYNLRVIENPQELRKVNALDIFKYNSIGFRRSLTGRSRRRWSGQLITEDTRFTFEEVAMHTKLDVFNLPNQ